MRKSIALSGVLGLLTVAELFSHADFYATHPQIRQFSEASGYSYAATFNIFLSGDSATDAYKGNTENASAAIQVLARVTAKPFVYSSQFHILALASVIRRPVFSVYPDIPNVAAIRNVMHGLCYPRQHFTDDESSCSLVPIHLTWTRAARSPLNRWNPNHFTPLVNAQNWQSGTDRDFTSYADAVKLRGKRRLEQFSFIRQRPSEKELRVNKGQQRHHSKEQQQQSRETEQTPTVKQQQQQAKEDWHATKRQQQPPRETEQTTADQQRQKKTEATGQRTFYYKIVSLWNSLDSSLKLCESVDSFKCCLKTKLLNEFLVK